MCHQIHNPLSPCYETAESLSYPVILKRKLNNDIYDVVKIDLIRMMKF